mmetsp:Transcript_765/g.1751  ORF Transcript_765/g.1751 Transcript_765/m.1751 type:complete len:349 (+) Transcript_765:143-1189(+)
MSGSSCIGKGRASFSSVGTSQTGAWLGEGAPYHSSTTGGPCYTHCGQAAHTYPMLAWSAPPRRLRSKFVCAEEAGRGQLRAQPLQADKRLRGQRDLGLHLLLAALHNHGQRTHGRLVRQRAGQAERQARDYALQQRHGHVQPRRGVSVAARRVVLAAAAVLKYIRTTASLRRGASCHTLHRALCAGALCCCRVQSARTHALFQKCPTHMMHHAPCRPARAHMPHVTSHPSSAVPSASGTVLSCAVGACGFQMSLYRVALPSCCLFHICASLGSSSFPLLSIHSICITTIHFSFISRLRNSLTTFTVFTFVLSFILVRNFTPHLLLFFHLVALHLSLLSLLRIHSLPFH